MTQCKHCGVNHPKDNDKYKVVHKIPDRGFPVSSKRYKSDHEQADKAEKKKFGAKSYDKMKKVDAGLHKHELAGKNSKTGKIEVSEKVPPKYRKEVAYHEKVENKKLRKK
jgi:hypothetical protein